MGTATRPGVPASAWESEVVKSMCEIDMNPERASPRIFHRHEVDGTGLVHRDDFVIVASKRRSKEAEDH